MSAGSIIPTEPLNAAKAAPTMTEKWAARFDRTVGHASRFLETIHSAGLPWWAAVMGAAVTARLVGLPLWYYQQRVYDRRFLSSNFLMSIALLRDSSKYPKVARKVYRVNSCQFYKILTPYILQVPAFVTFSSAVRSLLEEGKLHGEGALWFPDLSVADPGLAAVSFAISASTLFIGKHAYPKLTLDDSPSPSSSSSSSSSSSPATAESYAKRTLNTLKGNDLAGAGASAGASAGGAAAAVNNNKPKEVENRYSVMGKRIQTLSLTGLLAFYTAGTLYFEFPASIWVYTSTSSLWTLATLLSLSSPVFRKAIGLKRDGPAYPFILSKTRGK